MARRLFVLKENVKIHFFEILVFWWLVGSFTGLLGFSSIHRNILASLDLLLSSNVTFVGILCIGILPILFSFFFIRFKLVKMLYAVAFLKGQFFSFVSALVLFASGNRFILFFILLLSGDYLSVFLLWLFWSRQLKEAADLLDIRYALIFCVPLAVHAVIYCSFIMPLLASLFYF